MAEAMPVHTPGSGSDGMTVSSSPAILLQLPGETSFCYSFVCRLTSSCFHRWCVLVECAAREHGPHDPRILVGERDSRDIGMPPLPQLPKPEASGILLAGCFAEHSANAMDHQCAQIAIATFADTEQAGSPSTGSLFRHQAEPSRELTAVLEAGSMPTAAIKAVAVTGPMPSIFPSRWHCSRWCGRFPVSGWTFDRLALRSDKRSFRTKILIRGCI